MANSVKLGNLAGAVGQKDFTVAVGYAAGQYNQSTYSISIGNYAGRTNQLENSIAIGNGAGSSSQSTYSIALGNDTGHIGQGTRAVAVGPQAGYITQGINATAVGNMAGSDSQGISSVAIGDSAGYANMKKNAVAIGYRTGYQAIGTNSIAIGMNAGYTNMGNNSIAIGAYSGMTNMDNNSIIINATGSTLSNNGNNSLTIAPIANETNSNVLAYNSTTKEVTYMPNTIANISDVTLSSLVPSQVLQYDGTKWINSTPSPGVTQLSQLGDVSFGSLSQYQTLQYNGTDWVNNNDLELGGNRILFTDDKIKIGTDSGQTNMGNGAIAIGMNVGITNLGSYAIAIGTNITHTFSNGIILNGNGPTTLTTHTSGFFATPIRNDTSGSLQTLNYNTSTKEITYGPGTGSLSALSDVTFGTMAQYQTLQYNGTKWTNNNNLELGGNRILFTNDSVKICADAGYTQQGFSTIAIGNGSGYNNMGNFSIGIGHNTGFTNMGAQSIAMGLYAGAYNMGADSIAIGNNAGNTGMGSYCIAIGSYAGQTNMNNNTIILNATGTGFSTGGTSRFYVDPIRNDTSTGLQSLAYNTSTKEITYGATVTATKDWAYINMYGQISSSSAFNATSTERNFLQTASGPGFYWSSAPTTYNNVNALTINTSGTVSGLTASKTYMVDVTLFASITSATGGDYSIRIYTGTPTLKARCLKNYYAGGLNFSAVAIITGTTSCYFTIANDNAFTVTGGGSDNMNIRMSVVEI